MASPFDGGVTTARTAPAMPTADTPHTVARWAHEVISLRSATEDLRTFPEWGRHIGVSPSQLREHCRLAGVPGKAMDLARLLRAVAHQQWSRWPLEHILDFSDSRTLRRLVARSGWSLELRNASPEDFVLTQTIVRNPLAIQEILRCLRQ